MDDLNIIALLKGKEKYIWLYADNQRDRLIRNIGSCAADKRLSLTWYDAAVLAQRVRKEQESRK